MIEPLTTVAQAVEIPVPIDAKHYILITRTVGSLDYYTNGIFRDQTSLALKISELQGQSWISAIRVIEVVLPLR